MLPMDARPLTAVIRTFLTHQQSAHFYGGKASFELTEMNFQTSIGTYIDAPRHRFADMRDISELSLEKLVLDGFIVHVPNACAGEKIGLERLNLPNDIAGKAVLFRFEWDRYWDQPAYEVTTMVVETVKQFGTIDILVNNAVLSPITK